MTTVVISQPMYFPWAGFFEQMKLADVYVWLDDAHFSRGSYTNRIQVKGFNGRSWMTIPLAGKGWNTSINKLQPADVDWKRSHRTLLEQSLKRAPFVADALTLFDDAVALPSLVQTLMASAECPAKYLGILPPKVIRSSDLAIRSTSSRRVLEIVEHCGGTRYVTGHGAARYLDHELFEAANIEVVYMHYQTPPWPQNHGAFTPYVTVLDLIAALGAEGSKKLLPATVEWRNFVSTKQIRDR